MLRKTVEKLLGGAIVDVGNVLIDHSKTTPELVRAAMSKPWLYYRIPEVEGAMEALAEICRRFGGNVTLVYKATDTVDKLIINWMKYHRLTHRTGIPLSRVVRISDASDRRDKTGHINQESETYRGTCVAVDDRAQVALHFRGKVNWIFLLNPQKREVQESAPEGILEDIHVVHSWREIIEGLFGHT